MSESMQKERAVVMAGWDDVPHLDEAAKEYMLSKMPPHQRTARSKGVPQLGEGAVWPADEDSIVYDPTRIEITPWMPRLCALDVGWKRTAALWGAWDREQDILYLYSEHYLAEQPPAVHVEGIKARGAWIPVVIDPASRGRGQRDGKQLYKDYKKRGLKLHLANNAFEAGVYEVWSRMVTGRLKVSKWLENWLMEWRLYARNEKGKIPKDAADHLMDCTRYLCMGLTKHAIAQPPTNEPTVDPVSYAI